jgi:catalase
MTRLSNVGGEKRSADSARDPGDFSLKLYTEEANWDWVFNNTPVFFTRDPTLFLPFIHTQKRNPQMKEASMFWDYLSTHQESIHQVRFSPHDPLSLEFSDDRVGHDSLSE